MYIIPELNKSPLLLNLQLIEVLTVQASYEKRHLKFEQFAFLPTCLHSHSKGSDLS